MDLILPVIFLLTLFIFEPGNEKINTFCKGAVKDGTFETRKGCWDYYDNYREDIPNE
tara:strand:+ start:16539 stop:16709 length:171 start_codon:yes stop_codon:yes gene_type:complete